MNKVCKILSGVLALALLGGAIAGGWYIGKNYEPKEDDTNQEEQLPEDEMPNNQGVNPITPSVHEMDIYQQDNAPIKLASVLISRAAEPSKYDTNEEVPMGDYDIATAAATTSYSVTAAVTPSDAVNKVLDWSVAWKNPASTWAKSKTVTDYVTITPSSDGALTATLTCKQAFGEQVYLTVKVRDDESVTTSATVDYRQKYSGNNFSMKCQWSSNQVPGNWNMTYTNTSPTVDFITVRASGLDLQEWALGYCDKSNTTTTSTAAYSSTYTVQNGGVSNYTISVAPTQDYINALKAAGFTVTATAGTYYTFSNSDSTTNNQLAFGNILINRYVSNSNAINDSKMASLRSNLLSNASKTMLQIKVQGTDSFSESASTVYNVRFSTSSLSSRAASVSLSSQSYAF